MSNAPGATKQQIRTRVRLPDSLLEAAQQQLEATKLLTKETIDSQNVRPAAQPTQGWPIYVDSALQINFTLYSSVANLGQKAIVTTMDMAGYINQTPIVLAQNSTLRAGQPSLVQLAEGFLLGVEMAGHTSVGKLKRGQVYVQCYIGYVNGGGALMTLFNDYVAEGYNSSWPNQRVVAPTEGPGYLYNPTIAAPSAGVELSITVPSNTRWKIRSLLVNFTTTLTAGTRSPGLIEITDASGNLLLVTGPGTPPTFTTTGTTNVVLWLPGWSLAPTETAYDGGGRIRLPFFNDLFLPAGSIIKTVGTTFIGTDGYGIPQLLIEEWIEP